MLPVFLFLAIAATFITLTLPDSIYQTSPAIAAMDSIKRRLDSRYTGDRGRKLALIGKENKELLQMGSIIGLSTGFLLGILAYILWPVLTPIGIILGLGTGVILVDIAIENEYKRYQREMAQGTLPLANFMPSFLEAEGIIPRDALFLALPFIPEPLKSELETAAGRISRTGRVHEAMEVLTSKTDDPVVEAICFRLAAAWDAKVTADIFDDLKDELDNMEELAVTNETNAKSGYLALIVVIGLIGAGLIYGYPSLQYLASQMSMFG